jgi:HK97 gp10 family phage protein
MADEIRRLIDDMGKIPKDLKIKLRPGLREAGQIVRDRARLNASWSKRIPAATRVSVGFSKRNPGVAVQVNKNRAPHARPFEHDGRAGTFRHPVFGHRDRRWVPQKARPFLAKALEEEAPAAERKIADVVDKVTRDAGFH